MRIPNVLRSVSAPHVADSGWMRVVEYGRYRPSPLSMAHFIQAAEPTTHDQYFTFIRREIPVRMAGVLLEMKLLPESLQKQHGLQLIRDLYTKSFHELVSFEKKTDLDEFTKTIVNLRIRHAYTIPTMAGAVIKMKNEIENDEGKMDAATEDAIQYFLNRMYMSHISVRMLINQFSRASDSVKPGHFGVIDPKCDVVNAVKNAYNQAAKICDDHYSACPGIQVDVHNSDLGNNAIEFVYVRSHLHHICFEIFKNSMRATMEYPPNVEAEVYPDLKVSVVKSKTDVTIRLTDCGGGIERKMMPSIFKYTYTTASGDAHRKAVAGDNTVMAGLGYGLPLSRLYAQYFHGDIVVNSLDGHGTNTYVYLKAIDVESPEQLPVYTSATHKVYKPKSGPADWTADRTGLDWTQERKSRVDDNSSWEKMDRFNIDIMKGKGMQSGVGEIKKK